MTDLKKDCERKAREASEALSMEVENGKWFVRCSEEDFIREVSNVILSEHLIVQKMVEEIKESCTRIMTQGCNAHKGQPISMEELSRCPICDKKQIDELKKENEELKRDLSRQIGQRQQD